MKSVIQWYKSRCLIEEHEDDLTEVVNAWLQEHADIRLMDIKFSTAVS